MTLTFLQKSMLNNKSTPNNVKSNYEFCTFFSLHQLLKVTTLMTCNRATLINHILASYSERVTRKGIIDVGLSDHQLIFCIRKISMIERHTNMLNSVCSSIAWLTFSRKH